MSKLSQKQELRQQLSPRQVLQASLLQLNLPLLEQRILHELEVNPALELIDLPLEEESETELPEEVEEEEVEVEFDWEELLGEHDDYEIPKQRETKEDEPERPLVSQESFSERIIKQLRDCNLNEDEIRIAEEILGNLDEQGYLNIEPMLISDRLGIEESAVLQVMHSIQRMDPPGLASRNMQECLLAQAEVRDENPVAVTILQKYFDDFANHRYEKIMQEIQCTKEELNEAMEFISRLNPGPRDDNVFIPGNVVIPDVTVEDRGGEYHVVVQDGNLPEVRISKSYVNMLRNHKDEKDVQKFVKQKLEAANWFVDAVEQRKKTIQRVMESIINRQPEYFHSGEKKLQPMILQDVADDIGMDISTISRVTNGKYAQLPWEIKELKTFFSEGIKTTDGETISNTEVKKRLKEIIDSEDKQHPVGDEEITEKLRSEGYTIARRTITKYREQMKYPTARLRRKL